MSNEQKERFERSARLRWVPIQQMRVSPMAQRELNKARVDRMAASFDPEQIGSPTVNYRDGFYWIIDGQHRIETMKAVGWGDQQVQCWTYEGLSESDEAEIFLKLNDTLVVAAYDRFTKAVVAGRIEESDIDRSLRSIGCVVSKRDVPGAIGATGTLLRVYKRAGVKVLIQAISIARDAYGDAGLDAPVIDGLGFLCQRYNGQLDHSSVVERLGSSHGGVAGLLSKAEVIKRSTGKPRGQCVAAAAVEILNAKRGGKRLPSWWR